MDRTNDPCGRFGARAPAMPPPPVVPNVRFCACLGPRATTDPLGFDPKLSVDLSLMSSLGAGFSPGGARYSRGVLAVVGAPLCYEYATLSR